ncbi:heme ABC transporter ATP-binding protein [Rhodococcus fascians]|uniref:heme ABC transporter ATP-binding protein n=1 Tax=Nocardiaceae TaxID=85025 RepID=UPI0019D04621|nr:MULTISPECIES: heme ABC transporter ATP-binding protein [Rhodococcus]MBW4780197.1 heme ABC transporter ATP-binding protein [Rhodococcus fascians]MBY4211185.1 heme ABC transporter ATP-binding protein [Rhodococcus fascians]MBY4236178.1 heme ABC transporter ATP-binding protein [Rhodococcus fascians]MBY4252455.1 heme ABC transporter ATP-binding protein [Rhodococcus fascians]MBY4267524.1 heme ABC transporter ATP-binding protein [Rhodococcus fascians]
MIGKFGGHRSDIPADPTPGSRTLVAVGVGAHRGDRAVLNNVHLEVVVGEILALVGPNGAGKSTLLSVLSGDTEPSSGSVLLGERPLSRFRPVDLARRRAVLPQQHAIGFAFTAEQIVRMGRAPWTGTSAVREDDAQVAAAMAACDVSEFAGRPFGSLSGGEQSRVALARVMAQRTATIMLDEPTAALDVGHQESVMAVVRSLAASGRAVVVVLHDLGLAAAYADRVAILDAGELVATGPPREVLTAERLGRIYRHPVDVFDHPVTGEQLVIPKRGAGVKPAERPGFRNPPAQS